MKKKIIIMIVMILFLFCISYKLYKYYKIKNAIIKVDLVEDRNLEFNEQKRVSDFIKEINGEIINDYIIDSNILGEKIIKFDYINEEKIKVSYEYKINVVDTVAPVIWLGNTYNVKVNSDIDLVEKIMCGDNYDSSPNCFIEGEYNLNEEGKYNLVFKAIDSSGNVSNKDFILNVYSKQENKQNVDNTYTYLEDVIKKYKNENTKIGIDISSWQGDIDFEKVKKAGIEFVIIRVGSTKGIDGEYFLDKKFEQNIKLANEYGIDVGVYFYSYANSGNKAKENAEWVLKQIEGYEVNLPIAFDWESWQSFNKYKLSFFELTNMATDFIKSVENAGYKGMLYSSKSYLENIWFPVEYDIWLAHYTDKTNYEGDYKYWQLCSDGIVDGINGYVDINIMYIN